MLDYCVTESTRCDGEQAMPVVDKELSIKDQLTETENKLIETRSILFNIVEGITSKPRNDDKLTEAGCMQDSARILNALAESCLSLANRIHSLMF